MRRNWKDLTGQRFGALVVLNATEERRNGQVIWSCQCDCGKITLMSTNQLKQRKIPSCGCLGKGKKRVDLAGQRFEKLVALKPTGDMKWGSEIWECQCDCGRITRVIKANLINGGTRSCGCLRHAPRKRIVDKKENM